MLSAKNGRSQKLLLPPILQGDPDDLRDLRDLLPAGLPPGQQQNAGATGCLLFLLGLK